MEEVTNNHLFILYHSDCLSFESPRLLERSSLAISREAVKRGARISGQMEIAPRFEIGPWFNRGSRNFVVTVLTTQREARSFRWKIETRIIMRGVGLAERGEGVGEFVGKRGEMDEREKGKKN